MTQQNSVAIIDRDGWRKEVALPKTIVHIGSDPRNDVVLESWRGKGVAARHAQLIMAPSRTQSYRLVNLGDSEIVIDAEQETVLAPRAARDIHFGDRVVIGDFSLIFQGTGSPAALIDGQEVSGVIGLRLNMPQTKVAPTRPLDGAVIIQNLGDKPGVQFKLEIEGLDPDCYEIGLGPVLFPNAEKEVLFHIYHPRRPTPPVGEKLVHFRVTAPEAYPGESAVVSRIIQILPFYSHKLRLVAAE